MSKAEFIIAMAEKSGLTKAQAESALSATFATITDLLVNQEKVVIQGFGTFNVKVRPERKGRNPATGQEMTIKQTTVVSFKPAISLKVTLNAKDEATALS